MKKIVLSAIYIVACVFSNAQLPESFNYKAIPGNFTGATYPEQAMNISIVPGDPAGSSVYTETFFASGTDLNNNKDIHTDSEGIGIIGFNASLGGYVFYVTPDGNHGLVAATQDQSALSEWYMAQDVISNPANHDTVGRKFTDWRLPTKYELNLIYSQKSAIDGFESKYYWSSVENGYNSAWLQNFANGAQLYGPKGGTYCVRAVRTF